MKTIEQFEKAVKGGASRPWWKRFVEKVSFEIEMKW